MPRIYTRTGDKGLTSLYGGQRIPKHRVRLDVVGTLDELNAMLGLALSEITQKDIVGPLTEVQNLLLNIGAEVAEGGTKAKKMIDDSLRINPMHVATLERWIDSFEQDVPPLTTFILPGGSPAGARLHLARAVCRRAERRLAELSEKEGANPASLMYLNRLSDFLFVLARTVNHAAKATERTWKK
ncbi:MAG TPA: cob(I)yrinic acid a,c-diamide adenosyltransferase [Patescibacteria group bacterium]|jgi:cob(I)alamin adenosyltransferase